eukprot:scaffold37638_cov102-Skeletonema_marinoi.AAC.2
MEILAAERLRSMYIKKSRSNVVALIDWQAKRNRKGRKKHDRDVSRLRREFHCNVDKDVNDLAEHWISMNRKESE